MCQEGSRSIKFIMAYKKRLFHFVCIMFNIFNCVLDKNASSKALSKEWRYLKLCVIRTIKENIPDLASESEEVVPGRGL